MESQNSFPTMTVAAANETPVRQDQGSVAASNDNDIDSLIATPDMDGASFEALMKERARVSTCGMWDSWWCDLVMFARYSPLLYSHFNVQC
jgi:hypothetical protein